MFQHGKIFTAEDIQKAVDEAFKDYKDPTEGWSIERKREFHRILYQVVSDKIETELNKQQK